MNAATVGDQVGHIYLSKQRDHLTPLIVEGARATPSLLHHRSRQVGATQGDRQKVVIRLVE